MLPRGLLIALLLVPECAMASKGVLASANHIELAARPVTVTLAAPKLGATARAQRLFLVIRGLRADAAPGVLYHVYLDHMEEGRHVGILNFYNARADSDPGQVIYNFEITDEARALHLGDKLIVVIVPSSLPDPAAHPRISRVELVAD